jgi:hypothetical protein
MKPHISALERAFELARSGDYKNASEVKRTLAAEGYTIHQLTGPTLVRQINDLCNGRAPAAKRAATHRAETGRVSSLLRNM